MFEAFLGDKQPLTFNQQLKVLKGILQKASSAPQQFYKQFQKIENISRLEKTLSTHPLLGYEILLCSFSIEQCLAYMQGNFQKSKALKLFSRVCQNNIKGLCLQLTKLSIKYSTIQKQLVLIKSISMNSIKEYTGSIAKFLSSFIRLQAFVIEKYFGIKNQPSKNAQDYIESDLMIVKECQKWASEALINMFNNLQVVCQNGERQQRISVLICLSDVYTALLQAIRQKNLSVPLVQKIVKSANQYMFKSYFLQQIYTKQITDLKQAKYFTKTTKIQIKQTYNASMKLNSVAYSYWVLIYLSDSIFSSNAQIKYLILAFSQIVAKPYEFKQQIINLLLRHFRHNSHSIQTGIQWNYPIQLALFLAQKYQKDVHKTLSNKICFINKIVQINSLNILECISIDNLNLQKQEYILTLMKQHQLIVQKKSVITLKGMKLDGANPKLQGLFIEIIELFIKSNGKQLINQFIAEKISNHIFNPQHQKTLEKIYS